MLYDDRVCKEVLSKSRVLPIFGATLPASNELISKMKFSIDFGFFVCQRYMLIVFGKIAKYTQLRLEQIVK